MNPTKKVLFSLIIFGSLALGLIYWNSTTPEPTKSQTSPRSYEANCTTCGDLIESYAFERDRGISLQAALADAKKYADKFKAPQEARDTVNEAIRQVYEAKNTSPQQLRRDFESRCLALKP